MQNHKERIILGVDPGTNILGYGVILVDGNNRPNYLTMGVLDLRKKGEAYEKLRCIYEELGAIIDDYHPSDLAIESPFMGKNAQVILKLGRAQGAAIIAAQTRGVTVTEYAPRKAKIAICGNGAASKEQVALMVEKTLGIKVEPKFLDATDALAIAMCHYYQLTSPLAPVKSATDWKKFVQANPDRVK